MKQNELILLRTFLLSTSSINISKYSSDSKKKNRAVGSLIGRFFLILLLIAYVGVMCFGYGIMGLADSIPSLCAASISAISFFFTVLKVNGYIFAFKEYDMIMSLPFEVKSVVRAKFLYMYIQSIIWYAAISVACLIGYGVFAHPLVVVYPLWIVLSFLLPAISMILATIVGFIITKIGSGFKAVKLVQTILSFVFIILAFSLRYIVEAILKNNKTEDVIGAISNGIDNVGGVFWPIRWFSNAITKLSILDILLLVGVSVLLLELVFRIIASSYRKINSSLHSNKAHKSFAMKSQKVRSAVNAIAFKEYRRMTGSNIYLVNIGMGEVFSVILGVASLIFGVDKITSIVTQGAPLAPGFIIPAIPFVVYFFIGMVPSTVCSPSLEGKNYWIIQSLPVTKKTLYQGKILFNIYLTVPFMAFATLCMCISSKVNILDTLLYLITGVVLCIFSSCFGLLCGLKFMRLDWENEVEVVKQGTGVVVYLFPNMILTLIVLVAVAIAGMFINKSLISLIVIAFYGLLSAVFYRISIKKKGV